MIATWAIILWVILFVLGLALAIRYRTASLSLYNNNFPSKGAGVLFLIGLIIVMLSALAYETGQLIEPLENAADWLFDASHALLAIGGSFTFSTIGFALGYAIAWMWVVRYS